MEKLTAAGFLIKQRKKTDGKIIVSVQDPATKKTWSTVESALDSFEYLIKTDGAAKACYDNWERWQAAEERAAVAERELNHQRGLFKYISDRSLVDRNYLYSMDHAYLKTLR